MRKIRKLKDKWILFVGKIRRFFNGHFRKKRVKKFLDNRQNECSRCGACCKLMFNCPFLVDLEDGSTSCSIHEKRPVNCRIFPIDMKDIADRNIIDPNGKCGYIVADDPEKPSSP